MAVKGDSVRDRKYVRSPRQYSSSEKRALTCAIRRTNSTREAARELNNPARNRTKVSVTRSAVRQYLRSRNLRAYSRRPRPPLNQASRLARVLYCGWYLSSWARGNMIHRKIIFSGECIFTCGSEVDIPASTYAKRSRAGRSRPDVAVGVGPWDEEHVSTGTNQRFLYMITFSGIRGQASWRVFQGDADIFASRSSQLNIHYILVTAALSDMYKALVN
ncbi:MAG: hypothetical protein MHM6MM_007875 [Cercozoa sp. M6MM]